MLSMKGREPYLKMQIWCDDPHGVDKLRMWENGLNESRKRRSSSSNCPSPSDSPPIVSGEKRFKVEGLHSAAAAEKMILEKTQQQQMEKMILEKSQMEKLILEKSQMEKILEKSQMEKVLEKSQMEKILEKSQMEKLLEKTLPPNLTGGSNPSSIQPPQPFDLLKLWFASQQQNPGMAAALAASMSQPGGMGGLGAALAGAGLAGLPSNVGVLEKTTDNEDTKSDCGSEKGPRRKSTTPQQYLGSHDESTND